MTGPRPTVAGPRPTRAGRPALQMRNAGAQLTSIRETKKQIVRQIREIKKALKRAKNIPDSQPFISFKRATSIADLMGDSRSYKEALQKDLKKLRSQLKNLYAAESRAIRAPAVAAGKNFERYFEAELKKAEQAGSFDPKVLAALQKQAQDVVDVWANVLRRSPTQKNVEAMLEALGNAAVIGSDPSGKGFSALGNAANEMKQRAIRNFRRRPTSKNLAEVLAAASFDQAVGGDGDMLGNRVGNGILARHTVAGDDTLSGLAQRYYGDMGQWDIIFLHNLDVIGMDPDRVPRGIQLKIPQLAGQ